MPTKKKPDKEKSDATLSTVEDEEPQRASKKSSAEAKQASRKVSTESRGVSYIDKIKPESVEPTLDTNSILSEEPSENTKILKLYSIKPDDGQSAKSRKQGNGRLKMESSYIHNNPRSSKYYNRESDSSIDVSLRNEDEDDMDADKNIKKRPNRISFKRTGEEGSNNFQMKDDSSYDVEYADDLLLGNFFRNRGKDKDTKKEKKKLKKDTSRLSPDNDDDDDDKDDKDDKLDSRSRRFNQAADEEEMSKKKRNSLPLRKLLFPNFHDFVLMHSTLSLYNNMPRTQRSENQRTYCTFMNFPQGAPRDRESFHDTHKKRSKKYEEEFKEIEKFEKLGSVREKEPRKKSVEYGKKSVDYGKKSIDYGKKALDYEIKMKEDYSSD